MFSVFDCKGREYKCNFLFNFERDDKNFIVYSDNDDDILASFYEVSEGKIIISPIYDDNDFDIVDQEIARRREMDETE